VQSLGQPVDTAVRDLEDRTLSRLHGGVSKIVYLSATRNYNTGEYQHEGLAQRFGASIAQDALARCHETVFHDLLETSLQDLVEQLRAYIESTGAEQQKVLHSWRQLEAYRVLIPVNCDPLSADYFITNLRIALEALRLDARSDRPNLPTSLPQQ